VAAEEYHAEFAQKESTIAMLTAEAETQKAQHQQKIDKLRTDMEVCFSLTCPMAPQCTLDMRHQGERVADSFCSVLRG